MATAPNIDPGHAGSVNEPRNESRGDPLVDTHRTTQELSDGTSNSSAARALVELADASAPFEPRKRRPEEAGNRASRDEPAQLVGCDAQGNNIGRRDSFGQPAGPGRVDGKGTERG
jgi:hypothetical protein